MRGPFPPLYAHASVWCCCWPALARWLSLSLAHPAARFVWPHRLAGEVPKLLHAKKIHRVYVVNELGQATGVITFKELMAELLKRVKKVTLDWR